MNKSLEIFILYHFTIKKNNNVISSQTAHCLSKSNELLLQIIKITFISLRRFKTVSSNQCLLNRIRLIDKNIDAYELLKEG